MQIRVGMLSQQYENQGQRTEETYRYDNRNRLTKRISRNVNTINQRIESPDYFIHAMKSINNWEKDISIEEVLDLKNQIYTKIFEGLQALRKEKFFEKSYEHNILLTIKASDVYNQDEIIKIVKIINKGINTKDYIENIKEFI